jgi:toxin ParE1/3/4
VAIVIYAPEAEGDLSGIVDYIARDNPVAARNWLRKMRDTCDSLATHPATGELRQGFGVPGCRSWSMGNYVIFFRAIEGGIEVSRVIHGSRDMRDL